jgi:hypothetical protein
MSKHEFLKKFDWGDLNERTLKIHTITDETTLSDGKIVQIKMAVGFDTDTAVAYVLDEKRAIITTVADLPEEK